MSFKTLNRKEKRRKKRDLIADSKNYIYQQYAIEKAKELATKKATLNVYSLMLGFPLLVLRDNYGFGKKRLTDFSNKLLDLLDSYEKGYITEMDIDKVLFDEIGIKLKNSDI